MKRIESCFGTLNWCNVHRFCRSPSHLCTDNTTEFKPEPHVLAYTTCAWPISAYKAVNFPRTVEQDTIGLILQLAPNWKETEAVFTWSQTFRTCFVNRLHSATVSWPFPLAWLTLVSYCRRRTKLLSTVFWYLHTDWVVSYSRQCRMNGLHGFLLPVWISSQRLHVGFQIYICSRKQIYGVSLPSSCPLLEDFGILKLSECVVVHILAKSTSNKIISELLIKDD